jgi:linoleoyl-CoA desaturase
MNAIKFSRGSAFQHALDTRIDAYFAETGKPRRDVPAMYVKTAIILAWFVGSWALLVFVARTWWQCGAAALSLGLAMAGIGMCIQHDANHGGYSDRPWVNKLFGYTLDMIGLSSFIWRHKHNVVHHTYTNIRGVDYDIDFGVVARLSPEEKVLPHFRYQHVYMWFLYGFLLVKLMIEDLMIFVTGKLGRHPLPQMPLGERFVFVLGKASVVTWAFVIPALYHPAWLVLASFLVAAYVQGVIVASTFQIAHCVEDAELPAPPSGKPCFAQHQVETTTGFRTRSRFLHWFVAGLDHQIEHHLFPRICHVHYPALAQIVEQTAAEHGLRYRRYASVRAALVSHVRHLKRLGTVASP